MLPKSTKRIPQRWLTLGLVVGLLLLVVVIPSLITAVIVSQVKVSAMTLAVHSQAALNALKSQDLPTAKVELEVATAALATTKVQYSHLQFWSATPLRPYYQDGERVLATIEAGLSAGQTAVQGLEPYADVLGLKGAGTFTGGTAEDRLVKLVGTFDTLAPNLTTIEQKITVMDQSLAGINASRYPFKVNGKPVSGLITDVKSKVKEADTVITQLKPMIEVMPEIMGVNQDKKYFVLFQNDAELRSTGGFLTAYSIINMKKGKVSPDKSSDMYDLDAKFKEKIAPPDVVREHLLVNTLHLRDMNLSPDFKVSMDKFMGYYNTLPGEAKVDGVIAIDSQVLVSLLKVLGPIDVPGFGKYTVDTDPRCNCPQIIYEMEDIIGRPTPFLRSDRKAILGPMMQTILYKAYGAGKQQWPLLFNVLVQNLQEKHILFYFPDTRLQAAVETNNFAGRIKDYPGDYLHINDSNFGGAKSNMFISQEVEQTIKVNGGQAVTTLTMTYKNPTPGSNCNLEAGKLCLNGVLGNWQRVYLPKGSKLIDSQGYAEGSVKQSEDLGKAVVEGFFKLSPESQIKLTMTYSIPYNPAGNYELMIQKQPGTKSPHYTVGVNGTSLTFDLVSDKELSYPLK